MAKERIILFIAIIFTLVWVVKIPYLVYHPFQKHEAFKELSKEAIQAPAFIKEATGINGLSAAEIEKRLSRELTINWLFSIFFISWGCLSGYFLLRRKNHGRILAIVLSSIFIGHRLIDLFRSEHLREKLSIKTYALRFEYFPIETIQEELTSIILLATIIVLFQPSIMKVFKNNQANVS